MQIIIWVDDKKSSEIIDRPYHFLDALLQAIQTGKPKDWEALAAFGFLTSIEGVTFNQDNKYDIQLKQSMIHERRLGGIFAYRTIEKIELKTETCLWERTGKIDIEYLGYGKPSGIAVTKADYWVHELRRDGSTLVYLMFPMDRLKELAQHHYSIGHVHKGGGDKGKFCNILIPLKDILR